MVVANTLHVHPGMLKWKAGLHEGEAEDRPRMEDTNEQIWGGEKAVCDIHPSDSIRFLCLCSKPV